ncbi:MerR family transcriptional regulator [Daejeonella sp.]|uniref:MerR family transcriptional regulator n=1 Tax=Daejeonella sp. TaxID=2805397 RepID=UPI0039831E6B
MNLFSISQLSQYSGIKPHTIRIWEQRYNALKPERSEGNTRYYNNDQLRRLLNIVSLMNTDYKVSELCSMPDDKLSGLVFERKYAITSEASEYFISQLISAGMAYNQEQFEEHFEQCITKYGLLQTYKIIIHPMLVRVGLMWSANSIPTVQEHFISNIIRQKLLRSIDLLPPALPHSPKWVLFLPEDEFHEIGLLFAAYIIRESGNKVVYLGSSVSLEAVINAVKDIKPQYLLLFLVHYNLVEDVQQNLNELDVGLGEERIFVAGNYKLLNQIEFSEKVQWLRDIDSLEKQLQIHLEIDYV